MEKRTWTTHKNPPKRREAPYGCLGILRIGRDEIGIVSFEHASVIYQYLYPELLARLGTCEHGQIWAGGQCQAILTADGSVWSTENPRRLLEAAAPIHQGS